MSFLARYSGRTLEAYRHDLRGYFQWASNNDVDVLKATRPHIELFRGRRVRPHVVPLDGLWLDDAWFDGGGGGGPEREVLDRPIRRTLGTVATPGRPELAALGLTPGERVRWRDRPGGRWREGTVVERERDGSVGVRDGKGASRSLTVDRLEVRTRGPRGARTWEPLSVRAARTEQLPLFASTPALDEDRRR